MLFVFGIATFFSAGSFSVSTYHDPSDMTTPFPVALELPDGALQVVTPEQLDKVQLPDPESGIKMKPQFLLSSGRFTDGMMKQQSITGTSISNGQAIHIPTNYSAQIQAEVLDQANQLITLIYASGSEEDQIITAIYTANQDGYTPKTQYVKNVLIWKSIFMNGMMASLIMAFILCQVITKRKARGSSHIN